MRSKRARKSARPTHERLVGRRSYVAREELLVETAEFLEHDTIARGGSAGDIIPGIGQSPSMSTVSGEEDDSNSKGKKMGAAKARMFDFRKKVGEKFEEKKRHVEEKSRQIVEKMRGP